MTTHTSSVSISAENSDTDILETTWEKKYDISIEVLKDEYQICLARLKDVDEKSNKYLVIISIFYAGACTILASSLLDKLVFSFKELSFSLCFSYIFLLSLLVSIYYGFMIVRALLNSLLLVETRKFCDIHNLLIETEQATANQYKGSIIEAYQEIVTYISLATEHKQSHLKNLSLHTGKFILYTLIGFISLIFLKILGQIMAESNSNTNSNNTTNSIPASSIPSATHLITKPLTNTAQSSVTTSAILTTQAFDSIPKDLVKK